MEYHKCHTMFEASLLLCQINQGFNLSPVISPPHEKIKLLVACEVFSSKNKLQLVLVKS